MVTASGREEGSAKIKSQDIKGSNWNLQKTEMTPGCQASNGTGVLSLVSGSKLLWVTQPQAIV